MVISGEKRKEGTRASMRVAARTHLAQERARTQAWRESYDDASISRTLIRLMRGRGRRAGGREKLGGEDS